mmetsp:Transcript_92804/g.289350  ORF Transcript_92804/g.289350 Transcript_92804/m.289350 type:complete len:94 (+) Transcript_92804:77-358(+)|eukprot:CAMPEP_0204607364 /NCGR_PEP_ID=MMETSP0661-20131031/59668_1 /ASSEMBLY_ACC=CAM_ASM_000606 /TAXON_ID=109239 /ORGANISM="Alexandrium margalefi, Strain AMGDE01CS-322" /LENGTH=93 /DNA_ID=CAMNT_0051618771 /DNA_START=65 /DNA_END=346 /DNA_ORIENTATION=+
MTTVFKRMAVGGRAAVFRAVKVYRPGPGAAELPLPALPSTPLAEALAASKVKISFLEAETLKGMPLSSASTKTIDPYFAAHLKDVSTAYFGSK